MRDVEKRQAKVDLVVGLRKAVESKVEFTGLPFISYFDEIKIHDLKLAQMVV